MSVWRRILLALLELVELAVGPIRNRLREDREVAQLEGLRAEHGGWRDGSWVRVVSVACARCAADHHAGSVFRVKRFTTEASSDGEWVFDRPKTSFCHASGLVLEAAPPGAIAVVERQYQQSTSA